MLRSAFKKSDKKAPAKGVPAPAMVPQPRSDWDVPDRYLIQTIIGSGSYGQVCEAMDSKTNRVVAIKKIEKVFADLVDCKRILREIALLNRLKHNNVVKLLDVVVPPDWNTFDELYLVLEIADSDFKKLCRTPIFLTEPHIKLLLYNLLIGVKYIHSVGIYHRDLKPANCLVNQDCSVKICDFGLARTVDSAHHGPNAQSSDSEDLMGVPSAKNDKKQLTGHVVTRWYRAPELILLQKTYTSAIDIWSIGCIFAELLNMIKENVKFHGDRGPLFPGSCCFPLSPDHKSANDYTRGNRDQLNMIFDIIGTPTAEDIEILDRDDAKQYIHKFKVREGTDLSLKFKGSTPEAIDLLRRMLLFNPSKRISIDEALSHPLFKDIRNVELEAAANGTERVVVPFDDYQSMTEFQLRMAFMKEVKVLHPEVDVKSFFPIKGPSSRH